MGSSRRFLKLIILFSLLHVLLMVSVDGLIFLAAHVPPPEHEATPEQYIRQVVEQMLPEVRRRRLAEYCDVWCDRGAFSLDQCRRVLEAARGLGLGLRLHADQLSSAGATRLGVELGATSVDHLEQAEEGDLELLAGSATIATLLPGSAFHLDTPYPPARRPSAGPTRSGRWSPASSPTWSCWRPATIARSPTTSG